MPPIAALILPLAALLIGLGVCLPSRVSALVGTILAGVAFVLALIPLTY